MIYKNSPIVTSDVTQIFENYGVTIFHKEEEVIDLHSGKPLVHLQQDMIGEERSKALREAHLEADRIKYEAVQKSEKDRKLAVREGWDQGFKEGFEQGQEQALKQWNEFLGVLQDITGSVQSAKERLLEDNSEEIVDLSLAIARKVLEQELAQDHKAVLNIAVKTIRRAVDREKIKVLVNPADLAVIQEHVQELEKEVGGRGLEIYGNSRVLSGGCLLETESGSIDGRIETQLTEARKALEGITDQD